MPRAVSTALPPAAAWPVADAAFRVGVSISTLRSWERRYGLRPTGRTPGGHRRYTAQDIAVLQRVQRLVDQGVQTAEAAAAVLDRPAPTRSGRGERTRGTAEVDRLRSAADALDLDTATKTARSILRRHGVVAAWTDAFVPALQAAGLRWERTHGGVECEHMLAAAVYAALTGHVGTRRNGHVPRVVLAATDAEGHTLPLYAIAGALAERGIGACVLGTVPADALFAAVDRLGPAAVVLWARTTDTADVDELLRLTRRVPLTCAAGLGWSPRRRGNTRDLPTTVELLDAWLRGSVRLD